MTEETKTENELQEATATPVTDEVVVETDAQTETETVVEATPEIVEEPGIIEGNLKSDLPVIKPGDTVKVHQIIKEKNNKDRVQVFEGQVLAVKHGKGISATITVRKVISGIGVEKIFPIHSPTISKIEVLKRTKTRRAKLYYLREAKGRKARLKAVAIESTEK
jgi:large subunit ribosomal protein L19